MTNSHRLRILMIEDNPGDVELFRFALQQADLDCEVSVIQDGGEALAMVRREKTSHSTDAPDLIVLDLNLPKASGREILAEMRASTVFPDAPVMVLTSSSSPREREELGALHVARHLTKPPQLNEFLKIGSVVREVLAERE